MQNGNKFDPENNFKRLNHNINKISFISDQIWNYYIKSEKCLTCKLQEERFPPPCLTECNFCIHYRSYPEKGDPVVETRRGPDRPLSIYLTRATLMVNYLYKIPFIFRCTKRNRLVIHHRDMDHFNDSLDNIVIFKGSGKGGHSSIHGKITTLETKIHKILHEGESPENLRSYLDLLNVLLVQNSFLKHDKSFEEIIKETTKSLT